MRLIRLAIVDFAAEKAALGELLPTLADSGRPEPKLELQLIEAGGPGAEVFMVASAPHPAGMTASGVLEVDPGVRRPLEGAIERVADALGAILRARRSIRSPTPCIAFEPEDASDATLLSVARIAPSRRVALTGVLPGSELLADLRLTDDRIDGLRIMADARESSRALVEVREYVRLLESAFGRAGKPMAKALATFLPERFGYEQREPLAWIALRNRASHGDRGTSAIEADAWPLWGRIQQASFDVLLNKANWGRPDVQRRNTWFAECWSENQAEDCVAYPGVETRPSLRLLDQFGAYPAPISARLNLPEHWKPGSPDEGQLAAATLRVIARVQGQAR